MFLKNRNISSKIKRSKVTDYAALINVLVSIHFLNSGFAHVRYAATSHDLVPFFFSSADMFWLGSSCL